MAKKLDFASRIESSVNRSFTASRPNRVDLSQVALKGGFGLTDPIAVSDGGGGGGDVLTLQLGGLNLQLGGLNLTLTVA